MIKLSEIAFPDMDRRKLSKEKPTHAYGRRQNNVFGNPKKAPGGKERRADQGSVYGRRSRKTESRGNFQHPEHQNDRRAIRNSLAGNDAMPRYDRDPTKEFGAERDGYDPESKSGRRDLKQTGLKLGRRKTDMKKEEYTTRDSGRGRREGPRRGSQARRDPNSDSTNRTGKERRATVRDTGGNYKKKADRRQKGADHGGTHPDDPYISTHQQYGGRRSERNSTTSRTRRDPWRAPQFKGPGRRASDEPIKLGELAKSVVEGDYEGQRRRSSKYSDRRKMPNASISGRRKAEDPVMGQTGRAKQPMSGRRTAWTNGRRSTDKTNEISRAKAADYVYKSAMNLSKKSQEKGRREREPDIHDLDKTISKRKRGIDRATNKLATESTNDGRRGGDSLTVEDTTVTDLRMGKQYKTGRAAKAALGRDRHQMKADMIAGGTWDKKDPDFSGRRMKNIARTFQQQSAGERAGNTLTSKKRKTNELDTDTMRNYAHQRASQGAPLSKYSKALDKISKRQKKDRDNITKTSIDNPLKHASDKYSKGQNIDYTISDAVNRLSSGNSLIGGKSDKETIQSIIKKHNAEPANIVDQLKKGIQVEKEHTDDPRQAMEIAMDHLSEDPRYYTKLAKMEAEQYNWIDRTQTEEFTSHDFDDTGGRRKNPRFEKDNILGRRKKHRGWSTPASGRRQPSGRFHTGTRRKDAERTGPKSREQNEVSQSTKDSYIKKAKFDKGSREFGASMNHHIETDPENNKKIEKRKKGLRRAQKNESRNVKREK